MTEEAKVFLFSVAVLWLTFIPVFLIWAYEKMNR